MNNNVLQLNRENVLLQVGYMVMIYDEEFLRTNGQF